MTGRVNDDVFSYIPHKHTTAAAILSVTQTLNGIQIGLKRRDGCLWTTGEIIAPFLVALF